MMKIKNLKKCFVFLALLFAILVVTCLSVQVVSALNKGPAFNSTDATDDYFYQKVFVNKDWNNILLTNEAASDGMMDKYALNGNKTYIKYNYSSDENVLYIHTYLKFNDTAHEQFVTYTVDRLHGKHQINETMPCSYADLVTEAIEEYWSVSITGNEYDFAPGCDFHTKIVIHTSGGWNQKYIHVLVGEGDEQAPMYVVGGSFSMKDTGTVEYNYTGNKYKVNLYIKTNEQIAHKEDIMQLPYKDAQLFKRSVAHEFGHCLGLADAYDYTQASDGKTIKRVYKTDETGYFEGEQNQLFRNIMYNIDSDVCVVNNDIEMAIQAQADAFNGVENSWQSFADYEYEYGGYTFHCKQSSVIQKIAEETTE